MEGVLSSSLSKVPGYGQKRFLKIKEIIAVNKIQDQSSENIILSRKAFFVTPTCTQYICKIRFGIIICDSQNIFCTLRANIVIYDTIRFLLQCRFRYACIIYNGSAVDTSMIITLYGYSHYLKFVRPSNNSTPVFRVMNSLSNELLSTLFCVLENQIIGTLLTLIRTYLLDWCFTKFVA